MDLFEKIDKKEKYQQKELYIVTFQNLKKDSINLKYG